MKYELIEIREGLARIYIPNPDMYRRPDGVFEPAWAPVFYNPRMAFNRDIAILFLRVISKYLKLEKVYEPLAGTGVRGIRIALEVGEVGEVIINDIDKEAHELMKLNVKLNDLESKITIENRDANELMYHHYSQGIRASYVDIDPFGSPAPFVRSSLLLTRRRGYAAYTATDIAPLCGKYPKKALRRYHVLVIKTDFEREVALRSLISYIIRCGAEQDVAPRPVLAYYADHYLRAYFRIEKSASSANRLLTELGYINYCPKCLYREVHQEYPLTAVSTQCPRCGTKLIPLGPLWLGNLASRDLVKEMIDELSKTTWLCEYKRSQDLLNKVLRELDVEVPYYYRIDAVCSRIKIHIPKMQDLISCIGSRGYRAVRTHFDERGIRTNAPIDVVEDCVRFLRGG